MNKILKIVSSIPLHFVLIGVLVVFVLFFANPLTLISDVWTDVTKEEIRGNESVVVTDVKSLGKLKVLKRFVGGFLEVPTETPENEKERKHFRVVYQWEGTAEFTVDLAKVVRDTNTVDSCMLLHMPPIEIENLRTLPIDGTRCVIKTASLGYGDKADAILASMPQLVAKKIRMDVDTPENMQRAKDQAEYLLRSMITATKPGVDVKFDWQNK